MVTSSSFGHVPSHRLAWVGSWLSFSLSASSWLSHRLWASQWLRSNLLKIYMFVRKSDLFAEAKRTFLAAQYPRSIDQLRRFLSTYSESELKWDVTWVPRSSLSSVW